MNNIIMSIAVMSIFVLSLNDLYLKSESDEFKGTEQGLHPDNIEKPKITKKFKVQDNFWIISNGVEFRLKSDPKIQKAIDEINRLMNE